MKFEKFAKFQKTFANQSIKFFFAFSTPKVLKISQKRVDMSIFFYSPGKIFVGEKYSSGQKFRRGKFSSLDENFVTFPRRRFPRKGIPSFDVLKALYLLFVLRSELPFWVYEIVFSWGWIWVFLDTTKDTIILLISFMRCVIVIINVLKLFAILFECPRFATHRPILEVKIYFAKKKT